MTGRQRSEQSSAGKLFRTLIREGLKELGIDTPSLEDAFLIYRDELIRWSRAYNLTAVSSEREMVTDLFLDSLLYAKLIPGSADTETPLRLLDVGSGAGFPGMVIKIARPELHVTLLEPSRKKASFLRNLSFRLKLGDVEVAEEDLGSLNRQGKVAYDFITTRALFSVYELISGAVRVSSSKTVFILSKGPKWKEEIEEATRKFKIKGASLRYEITPFKIPLTDKKRYLIRVFSPSPYQ